MTLAERRAQLERLLAEMGSVVVAFSGGVDSALLAVMAHRVLGARALAVTADSESLAGEQRQAASALARAHGFAQRVIHTRELDDPLYARNAPDRCYHCKAELFRHLLPLAGAEGYAHVAYGLIADDLGDYRPGRRAADEAGVRSPLAEAGFTKDDVRALSRELGIAGWDRPASPCLSSRLPYGTPVTAAALRQVEQAESALRALGLVEFRVRHLGRAARLEIAPAELERLTADQRNAAERALLRSGFDEAHVDPQGYRRGRLNEALRIVSSA